jgi:hypothetical protein
MGFSPFQPFPFFIILIQGRQASANHPDVRERILRNKKG